MKEPSYAILGLGRFGRKMTTVLASTGAQILIADQDKDTINRFASYATSAVCLDLSNANLLEDIGLEHIDIAVVDLSHHLEPAIMSITVAREMGIKKIIATAETNRAGKIFQRVGATEIVIPADEAAIRMARRLISEDFMEFYDLGGNLCIIKIHPKDAWVGKTIKNLRLPAKERVTIVAIEENGKMSMNYTPNTVIQRDSAITIALRKEDIYTYV